MNTLADKSARPQLALRIAGALAVAVGGVAMIALSPGNLGGALSHASFHLKAPDLHLIARQSPVLLTHIFSAVTALAIGIVILSRPKGRGLHKTLGWGWVIAMASAAVSSLFLSGLNGDRMSLIHLLSGWTIIALPMAIFAIRSRKVEMHRRMMTGLFTGGLVIAGLLTFLPGRLMWDVFFS
ncbi:MAG: DUF2306 domain-containing protein [Hyphomonadaceae bacterium]|nr:MAG: hypothetical protein FD160_3082 [Caulobacteraceae bacterium]MBT9444360.1 DUF2306 domain-containing protein [Hyphomonadaceae bacterium]TPW06475.1 MAG: hypothetical protein FD124_1719 [Alphaproteobacteria bacterium]